MDEDESINIDYEFIKKALHHLLKLDFQLEIKTKPKESLSSTRNTRWSEFNLLKQLEMIK